MLEHIDDMAKIEVEELAGTIRGMFDASEEQEQFIVQEIKKITDCFARLAYYEAMSDTKRSIDKLIQEKLWGQKGMNEIR